MQSSAVGLLARLDPIRPGRGAGLQIFHHVPGRSVESQGSCYPGPHFECPRVDRRLCEHLPRTSRLHLFPVTSMLIPSQPTVTYWGQLFFLRPLKHSLTIRTFRQFGGNSKSGAHPASPQLPDDFLTVTLRYSIGRCRCTPSQTLSWRSLSTVTSFTGSTLCESRNDQMPDLPTEPLREGRRTSSPRSFYMRSFCSPYVTPSWRL